MSILPLIKSRRSIRKYKEQTVEKRVIEQVLEAGIWAPSSMNRQPWRFVVAEGKKKIQELSKQAKQDLGNYLETEEGKAHWGPEAAERFKLRVESEQDTIFYHAPVVIFVIQTLDTGNTFDYGLASQNMMLEAHSLGLGTCAIGLAKPMNRSVEGRRMLGLKESEKIIMAIILGYPAEEGHVKERKEDTINWL